MITSSWGFPFTYLLPDLICVLLSGNKHSIWIIFNFNSRSLTIYIALILYQKVFSIHSTYKECSVSATFCGFTIFPESVLNSVSWFDMRCFPVCLWINCHITFVEYFALIINFFFPSEITSICRVMSTAIIQNFTSYS